MLGLYDVCLFDITSKTPPNAADLAADLAPVRSCKKPPVRAPAAIEFQGSSCIAKHCSVLVDMKLHIPQRSIALARDADLFSEGHQGAVK